MGCYENCRILYQNLLEENIPIFTGHYFGGANFIQNVISFELICPPLILLLYCHRETSLFTGNQVAEQSEQ